MIPTFDRGASSPDARLMISGAPHVDVRRLAATLLPGMAYLLTRAAGVGMLALLASHTGHRMPDLLRAWDGGWYLHIVQHGYAPVPGAGAQSPLAFFPAYPALMSIFGGSVAAGVAVSTVAGVATAYGLTALARRLHLPQRAGLLMVVLFAAAPGSEALTLVYADATFCALAVWALVAVLDRRWLIAAALTVLAGLTRPTAVVLVAVVMIAAYVDLLQRRGSWRRTAAVLLAPMGLVAYLGYVGYRTGYLDGYTRIQWQGWHTRLDGGVATARWVWHSLTGGTDAYSIVTGWIILVAVVLAVLLCVHRVPWPIVTYTLGVAAMTLCTSGILSTRARELLPAVGLLVPLAIVLARQSRPVMIGCTSLLALGGMWYSAACLTVWPYAI